jgi:hypothetical protein
VQVDERSCLRGGGHRGEGSVRPASAGTRIGSEKPEHESQRVVYLAKISSREVAPVERPTRPGPMVVTGSRSTRSPPAKDDVRTKAARRTRESFRKRIPNISQTRYHEYPNAEQGRNQNECLPVAVLVYDW